ncbi:putative thioredoxin [Phytophthora cinnamomi]|uniref:putative thioredoxin n=1 Tax=Phytophthora cinnamomi TaxID=4785 RepID=UPI00355A4CCC|nr:putative thioredoxin [Phytophthora cinnamomi]
MPVEIKTPEDFKAAIGEKQLTTVQLSAPRCGGCDMVAPKVTQVTENEFLAVKFLKVTTEEPENVCEEIDVDCFPIFRVCKDVEMATESIGSHLIERGGQIMSDTKRNASFTESPAIPDAAAPHVSFE